MHPDTPTQTSERPRPTWWQGRGEVLSSPLLRAALVVLAVLIAYRYSLKTLVSTLDADTPLAYLGLAPLMAFGIAVLLARPARPASEVSDRNVDFLVGIPLLGTAVIMTLVLPGRMSVLFWYYRVDLLSLPIFAAGVVVLLFGAATLWRVRYAVGFLLLAWPVPYTFLLNHGMTRFSDLTLGALHGLVRVVHVASPQAGGDGSLFALSHAGHPFTLSVASACTGVDSFVGFLLVGLAFLAIIDGRRLSKVAWLVSGMVLVYALNLLRIMLIFWVGAEYGERVAIDGLHPVLGLVLFCAGVVVMVLSLGAFRLEVRSTPADQALPSVRWRVPGRLRIATAAIALVTVLVGTADGGFGRYGPVAGNLGAPRLVSFADAPVQPAGWSVEPINHYPWASQYFGSGATWTRYEYVPSGGGPTTVLADVVNTADLSSFTTYDVVACYDYHGYGLSGVSRVNLVDGVSATELTFKVTGMVGSWNALYWIWPVKAGQGVRYERVVLLAPVDAGYVTASYTTGATPRPGQVTATALQASRNFLWGFAREIVGTRISAGAGPSA